MAIIHLGQTLPAGSSDLPGGRGPDESEHSGGQPLTPPYLVLHREEFAWPRMSPYAPVRSYFKPNWAAPFHPSPRIGAGLFSVALVVDRFIPTLWVFNSIAPPLAGSLPCSVRTFLS